MIWRAVILLCVGLMPLSAAQFTQDQLAWWSYQPVRQPAVPQAGAGWAANEIDHFIARKFAEQKLTPAGPAAKLALIRRVTLDLTGLPPTQEQVALARSASDHSPPAGAPTERPASSAAPTM